VQQDFSQRFERLEVVYERQILHCQERHLEISAKAAEQFEAVQAEARQLRSSAQGDLHKSCDINSAKTQSSSHVSVFTLDDRNNNRVDTLAGRLMDLEARVQHLAMPDPELRDALKAWPPQLEALADRLDSDQVALRQALADELANEASAAAASAQRTLEATGSRLERLVRAEQRTHAEEFMATQAFTEESAAAAVAASENGLKELKAVIRKAEAVEARHRQVLAELEPRIELLEGRGCVTDAAAEPPWADSMRVLEVELKAILAAQVEDSTAAFRSVALLLQQRDDDEQILRSP